MPMVISIDFKYLFLYLYTLHWWFLSELFQSLALFIWFFKEFIRLHLIQTRLQFIGFHLLPHRVTIKLSKLSDLLELRYERTPVVGHHTQALRLSSGRMKDVLQQMLLRLSKEDYSGNNCWILNRDIYH